MLEHKFSALMCCAILVCFNSKTAVGVTGMTLSPHQPLACHAVYEFWDGARNRCASCKSYCNDQHAVDCETKCPAYTKERQCDELFFYDSGLEKCISCSAFCVGHEQTENTETCEKKCPAYMELAAKEGVTEIPNADDPSNNPRNNMFFIALTVGAVAVVSSAAVGALVMYKRCGRPCLNTQKICCYRRHQMKHPQQVVDDASASQHILAPGGTTSQAPPTGR